MAFDRRFYTAACVTTFAAVFVGFARTYYLKFLFGTPALPWLLHLHGALMTSWFVLFFAQTCLVAGRRVDLHRRLGVFGAVLTFMIVGLGVVVSVRAAMGAVSTPPTHPAEFLALLGYNLVSIVVFAGFVAAALILRRRSDYHKRLMLLAALSILGQPLARVVSDFTAVLLVYSFVLVYVAIDTARHHRLHPAFAWGAPLLIVALHLAFLGYQTTTWIEFARRLVS